MLGISDTTLGVITSVLLHAGVVVAFFGPLGNGQGAGESVVMVSVDGVDPTTEEGQKLSRAEPERPLSPDSSGSIQVKNEKREIVEPQRSAAKIKRVPPSPVILPQQASDGPDGGGGLLGALYAQPRLISIPKPAYPRTARERGVEGKVGVKVLVDAQGHVESAEVVQSSGLESFDLAARESALAAQFAPALKAGVPSAAVRTILVTFSLLE